MRYFQHGDRSQPASYQFPLRRITVNLAPADVRKEGPVYDLPIAVAILVASGQIEDRFASIAECRNRLKSLPITSSPRR